MCNQGIGRRLEQTLFSQQSDYETLLLIDQRREIMVDSSSPSLSLSPSLSPSPCPDDTPRVKFLCSFGGSILPRPQDGKLRYVGGETRIMSLPREISYEELMMKMKELFDGASLLKYQQPDEDLDALVSVVNDDDVTNMMEEYDKLGSGDGFTRLRIFLFSHPDQDAGGSSHFDADERETERRYVDALNSLNDSPEFRKQLVDSPVIGPIDNVHVAEQFFNPITLDAGFQNQRNCDIPLPQFNLHHLRIPRVGSGQQQQHQQAHIQRYNEMEAPWSPAYYSPRHHGHHDPRTMMEFPTSPSSSRYRMNLGDPVDKVPDRMSEEYLRQQMNHPSQYEQQQTPPFVDNVVRLPPGPIPGDKGFPGNIGHVHNVFEGSSSSSINEQRRMMAFHRNQNLPEAACHPDSRWKHGGQSHLEQPSMGNEFHHVVNSCSDCNPSREPYLMNTEQNGTRSFYNEAHNHERGRVLNHQLNYLGEEPRTHVSGVGRVNEHYMLDGAGVNYPLAHGNCGDGHQVFSNCINHETPRYIRPGTELGNEGIHDQTVGSGPHVHVSPLEDPGLRYGNFPSAAYGTDNPYQVSHGPGPAPAPAHAVWRKMQNPLQRPPSYEPSPILPQGNGSINPGFLRGTREGSPSFRMDNASAWNGPPQQVFGFDSTVQYHHGYAPRFNSNTLGQENPNPFYPDQAGTSPETIDFAVMKPVPQGFSSSSAFDDKVLASIIPVNNAEHTDGTNATGVLRMEEKNMPGESSNEKPMETVEESDTPNNSSPVKTEADGKTKEEADGKPKEMKDGRMKEEALDSNVLDPAGEVGPAVKLGDTDGHATVEQERISVKTSSVLPEVMASVKNMALEVAEEVKDKAEGNVDGDVGPTSKEAASDDAGSVNTHTDVEVETDNDHPNVSKIEPTKAEAEALARGLQMIKNDDLEEIRELGSGTYGAVYHGKWKGSDVAIKRIKASCFSGRPSERERLIADFWKEALILSSLHHPNVVSFYGIVRDGPDGSLATVTEFMVNGSMKQFLQKKDRTMDRRKRLIIAMDVAFGMEYLHGKNVVHFDLKCENLLVNMRDHNRPVCKGDGGVLYLYMFRLPTCRLAALRTSNPPFNMEKLYLYSLIGDLGLSKVKQHTLVSGGVRGTLPWMAPELLSGKSNMVTEKIDVYSFGIVLWELLTGEEPYADMHCASLIGGIVNNNLRPETPTWCDPEWKSLMESCWASEPGERPSFSEISQKLRKMAAAINLK